MQVEQRYLFWWYSAKYTFFVSFHSAWQGAKPTTPLLLLDGKGPSRKPLFMLLSPLCSHRLNSRTPRLFLASHFCGGGTCTVARPFFKAVPRSHAGQNLYSMLVFFRGYAYYSQNGSMCVCKPLFAKGHVCSHVFSACCFNHFTTNCRASCRGTQHLCPTVCNEGMGASGKGRQTCLQVPANWVEYLGNVKLQLVSTQWGIWAVLSAAGDHKQ